MGQPTGSFQVPGGLAPGTYHIYIDESNTTPLPGNGPNDAYQTARGTSLGTVQSATTFTVDPLVSVQAGTTSTGYGAAGDTIPYSYLVTNLDSTALSGVAVADPGCLRHQLPEHHARHRCLGDLHRHLHGDPGRRGRRLGDRQRHRFGHRRAEQSGQLAAVRRSPSNASNATSHAEPGQVGRSPLTPAYGAAGDVLNYNYLVTNTGTTTESNSSVSDNKIATVTCPSRIARPRGVGDLHRQLHGDPGRRGHRLGDQHGHRQRHQRRSPSRQLGTVLGDGGGFQRHLGSEHLQVDRLDRVRSRR